METSVDKRFARALTAADLCDRCPDRAVVETATHNGSLLWCAHHFSFFEEALTSVGATILVDERCR